MRIKAGKQTRRRHKKIRRMARGYYGQKSSSFRKAQEAVLKSLRYAYRHRKEKKRERRALWIVRINAACRNSGLKYSEFIKGLREKGLFINRKNLAEIAVREPKTFEYLLSLCERSPSA